MASIKSFRWISKRQAASSICGCLLGIAFSAVVGFIALSLTGAGHGTGVFAALIFGPEPLGLFIWPLVGLLLPWAHRRGVAVLIVALLISNYVSAAIALLEEDTYYVARTFASNLGFTLLVLGSYLLVQVCAIFPVIKTFRLALHRSRGVS